jgi:hypothetical protein
MSEVTPPVDPVAAQLEGVIVNLAMGIAQDAMKPNPMMQEVLSEMM